MKTISTSVKKWGNSLAIRIPQSVAEDLGLELDSNVVLSTKNSVATFKLEIAEQKLSLEKLVSSITPEGFHQEVDWGEPAGKEAW